ncbi:MAG: DUF6973 domain-containing protein [Flavobacteriales bacterium]
MTRGEKRYELSDHLGNVHVVVTDRKKTECVSNVFSAYEPEIINTYDYYPFGMLMEERKGQKPECTTSSSATTKTPYNYTFTWLTHDFIMYGTNVTVGSSGSALTVDRNSSLVASNWGTQKSGHSLVKGVTYTLSYQLQGAAPSGYTSTIGRTVQVRLKWGTTVMASGTLTLTSAMQSGSFNYTADYTGDYTIEIIYTGAGLNKGQFLADNVKITYNSQLTTVNCGVAEKYLYGFNGKEKTDEIYGVEGTFYDYGFRVYDSRIARFLSVDPLFKDYPWNSSYAFAENDVIRAIDLEGLERMIVTTGFGLINITRTTAATEVMRADATSSVFFLHPIASSTVGSVERGGVNISSVSGRIARHVAEDNNMTTDIGSERNAFRHALWSAAITAEFDERIASRIGDAHEGIGVTESAVIDFTQPLVQDRMVADEIVDFLNNIVGRNIGAGFGEDVTQVDIAREMLRVQRDEGLWVTSTTADRTISISRQKITETQFNTAIERLNTLDENGFNEADRQTMANDNN